MLADPLATFSPQAFFIGSAIVGSGAVTVISEISIFASAPVPRIPILLVKGGKSGSGNASVLDSD